jgi:hypothetical protein
MNSVLAFVDVLLLDVPVRYSYKPWRAIGWGVLICLVAMIFFARITGAMVPADVDTLVAAVDLFLPVIDLDQERFWVPDCAHPFGTGLWVLNWIVILSGWYLTTLFISSFTGLLKVE